MRKKAKVFHFIYGLTGGGAERIIIQLLEQRRKSNFENRLVLKQTNNIEYDVEKINETIIDSKNTSFSLRYSFNIFPFLVFARKYFPARIHRQVKKWCIRYILSRFFKKHPELLEKNKDGWGAFHRHLWQWLMSDYNSILNVGNVLTSHRPDIVSSTLLESANATVFFTKFLNPRLFKDIKWVAAIHNNTSVRLSDIYDPETAKFWMNLTPIILADTNKVIAVSEGVKKDLVSSFGISSEKIQTILNPVDLVSIDQVKPAVVKKPFIISVGRLCSQKRFDILIDAFAACADQLPHDLLLFGKGELEEDLKQKVAELGLQDRVQFMGFSSDVWSYMKTASCLVMTSQYEGLPMTLLEAKACGCPIVSYDCDYGPSELIKNDVDGFLVEYDNFDELTRRIIEICTDPKANSFSKNGLENVHQFSIEKVHANYEQLFESLLRKTFNTG